jgi:hypothetical protein
MTKTYCFDMDGTIADLYGVENWLDYLINEKAYPYEVAKPMVDMARLARLIHKVQRNGHRVEIISWLSKSGTEAYNMAVTLAKMEWLKKHLPSVTFDAIYIVPYGTPKSTVTTARNAILFDDEERNRIEWENIGKAFTPDEIFDIIGA